MDYIPSAWFGRINGKSVKIVKWKLLPRTFWKVRLLLVFRSETDANRNCLSVTFLYLKPISHVLCFSSFLIYPAGWLRITSLFISFNLVLCIIASWSRAVWLGLPAPVKKWPFCMSNSCYVANFLESIHERIASRSRTGWVEEKRKKEAIKRREERRTKEIERHCRNVNKTLLLQLSS